MANELVLGLVNNRGCTIDQAKQIFRLIRDHGYQLEKAFNEVMCVVPEFAKMEEVKAETQGGVDVENDALGAVQEDVKKASKKPKEKSKPKKAKAKGKKK